MYDLILPFFNGFKYWGINNDLSEATHLFQNLSNTEFSANYKLLRKILSGEKPPMEQAKLYVDYFNYKIKENGYPTQLTYKSHLTHADGFEEEQIIVKVMDSLLVHLYCATTQKTLHQIFEVKSHAELQEVLPLEWAKCCPKKLGLILKAWAYDHIIPEELILLGFPSEKTMDTINLEDPMMSNFNTSWY